MNRQALALVPSAAPSTVRKPRAKPTPESVKKLQARARSQALRICRDFAADLESLAASARAVVSLGDAAPVGVRELAARVADDATFKAATIRKLAR